MQDQYTCVKPPLGLGCETIWPKLYSNLMQKLRELDIQELQSVTHTHTLGSNPVQPWPQNSSSEAGTDFNAAFKAISTVGTAE